ncbi:MAG: hypothetical protein SFW09_13920 [Hyphomicrobiaceae bacterium]|nr:hypothetical protein [Hyphomicrobiaceae bacterium]
MARLIRVPHLASLLVVTCAREIDDLIAHPSLARAFARKGPLLNRLLVAGLDRQFRHHGDVLPAFRPKEDPSRVAAQRQLFARLDALSERGVWPSAPVTEMGRYVATGADRRNAEAALAYAVAWPFIGSASASTEDDAYKPLGRHLWRLHRRTALAREPASPRGLALRLAGLDRRARATILDHVGGDLYGLHAVEITLANARTILEAMREAMSGIPEGAPATGASLAWAAIRTAPERVVRQTGATSLTLPGVDGRIPPHTLVLLQMRRSLGPDLASGYEFASRHWSACPARRFVMGLFTAVAEAALALKSAEVAP